MQSNNNSIRFNVLHHKWRYALSVVLALIAFKNHSQSGSLTTKWDSEGVQLKWYTQSFVNYKGVHIYRKTTGDWQQLTTAPISANLNSDPNTNDEIEMVNGMIRSKKPITGIPLLNAMVASFKYQEIAQNAGIYFQDKTLTSKEVQYKIATLTGETIAETTLNTSKEFAVATPANFNLKHKRKQVKLYWSSDPMAFYGVNIYAYINDTLQKFNDLPVMPSNQTNYDTSERYQYAVELTEKTTYRFFIRSMGFFNDESAPSKEIVVTMGDITPPAKPEGLNYSQSGKNTVHLTWDNYHDTSANALNVYRGLHTENMQKVQSLDLSATNFDDQPAISGDLYYALGSEDLAGNINLSIPIIVHVEDMNAPDAPTQLSARSDSGKVFLTWNPVSTSDLKGYLIFRSGGKGKDFKLITTDPLTTSEYVFNIPLRTKSKMNFFVIAVDSAYNRSQALDTVSVSQPDYIAPQKPLIKNAMITEKGIILLWLNNTEKDLYSYRLYRKDLSDTIDYQKIKNIPAPEVQYTDTAIQSLHRYQYYLVAQDSSQNSSKRSNIFTCTAPYFNPQKEPQLHHTLEVKWKYKRKAKTLHLKWKAVDAEGYVVFHEETNRTQQKTGLLQTTHYTISDVPNASDWQVIGYTDNGTKYKSQTIHIPN